LKNVKDEKEKKTRRLQTLGKGQPQSPDAEIARRKIGNQKKKKLGQQGKYSNGTNDRQGGTKCYK